jgi:hypothetical protein
MTFIRRPNRWLCFAAFAAAFWITLRVVAAPETAKPTNALTEVEPTSALTEVADDASEVRDPALERMISRFAREALLAQTPAQKHP